MCHISTMPKMMSAVNPTLSPNTTTLVMRSTVRRLKLSATTPASIPKMTAGTVRATSIIPRSAADPPRYRMNRGLANWSIHRAKAWVICPSQRNVKSLYCREANVPPIRPPPEALPPTAANSGVCPSSLAGGSSATVGGLRPSPFPSPLTVGLTLSSAGSSLPGPRCIV